MLHQYIVTDTVPEISERIASGAPELPIIRDPEESWYLRQERDGYILGPYEKQAAPWGIDGIPPEFGMDLMPPDLDRVEHIVVKAMARVPAAANAGVKTVINGRRGDLLRGAERTGTDLQRGETARARSQPWTVFRG